MDRITNFEVSYQDSGVRLPATRLASCLLQAGGQAGQDPEPSTQSRAASTDNSLYPYNL
jgi:hypothetical protein